ncbi:hypothetical protein [Chitinophaga tropicalis]|uniref:Uncharacterized protein n=1 Tax=Chitinophaga tropicalis TaxID=2683588 RepID=A0A7K1UBS3_9BACT|nr:hypothetical protein [Chitinophaga tropicalis]MVT11839.1 hypothetical protein [Chitinophaga tropicalis]
MSVKKFFAEQDYRLWAAMFVFSVILNGFMDYWAQDKLFDVRKFIDLSIRGILFTAGMSLFGIFRKIKK